MSSKKCSTCIFGDKCRSTRVCEDYYPITERAEDECIDEMLEADYREFCNEWQEYINHFYD